MLIAMRPLLVPIPPHDFWWHMATGRISVESGHIPTTDTFSYTRYGEPFYNQGWFAQVIMYSVHNIGGIELILVVQSLVVTAAYGGLLFLCIRLSGRPRLSAGVLLLLIMPLSFDNWNVRPQTYAFPLFVIFLVILTLWRTEETTEHLASTRQSQSSSKSPFPTPLWVLPIVLALWANIHGSFVLGGVLIAFTFVIEGVRRFLADHNLFPMLTHTPATGRRPLWHILVWGGVSAVALVLNPRGYDVLVYVRDLLNTSAVTTLVTEWAPPTVRDTGGAIFFAFVVLCGVVLAYARRPPYLFDMVLAAAFVWLAFGASRNIVWFGMVAFPLLVLQLATLLPEKSSATGTGTGRTNQGVPIINALIIAGVGLLLVLTLPWVKPHLGLPPELGDLVSPDTPVEAVAALRADPDPPEHLYHAMSYGSYLIWAAPDQPVFADPRIELYPYEQWQEYIALNAGINTERLLEKYQIDGLLLDKEEQAGLLRSVRNGDGDGDAAAWEVRYEDEQTIYMVRR